MDSEEPPNVRVACSGDIDEVVRLMHDAAAWMSAKGTPAWDVARIDRTFAETFVLRSELLVASCGSVAKIVKLEHAWRRLDGRNDDGFQVAPFPG
ncbi:hypothetical protein [Citrobacter werkmanii]|uniref:hypothetical protein n=1 Tax=Citrobacter werkmanii TaxID=67827 RepID=UPI002815E630|nr:hypothetical protein [Citrobacter werkmanii]NTY85144.1 hypothetical protein [Citrobacter werkmanii]